MKKSSRLLISAGSARDAWGVAIAPWFERVSAETWKRSLPTLIVVPTRGHVSDLKARLIAKGLSHLGLHFVTPTGLRALLARNESRSQPVPAYLRLLLAVAASEMKNAPGEAERLAAKAVARSPGLLLGALDRLSTAGWKFEELALPSFAPVVQGFDELLKKCGLVLPGEADRQRFNKAAPAERKFSDVLITGFNGAHWSHWFLLRTAVVLAENATVVVEEPGADFSDIDLCWIGSWEEMCGEAQRAPNTASPPGDLLFSETEMRGDAPNSMVRLDFLVSTNVAEQAEAIAHQCVRYLAEEKCTRLGVIFSGSGALPRLVTTALARLEIPHNDGLGHIVPGVFESGEWQAWLELQRAPRVNSFLHFLNSLTDPAILTEKISRSAFENVLRESYSELLLDDLEILREFCARHADERFRIVAGALRTLLFLPARAAFGQFLQHTHDALTQLGWKQHALEIASGTHDWPQRFDTTFSRALFLRWLEETAATFRTARAAAGDNPYARAQLLHIADAQNQEWSHLIFAGWNEGAWPPPSGAEFARPEEIRAFNRSVQQLNKRAARQGSQGEGHTCVRENHSLYLGPIEQRAIASRQFEALLESATEAVTFAASLVQEDAPERFWNPSESFTQLYVRTRREPLTQSALKKLHRATVSLPKPVIPTGDVQQSLVAFNARRDPTTPASEYDFALRPNGSYRPHPTFSVSDLENMVSSPAIVWLKRYLGIEPPDEMANPWAATSGKWVHHWLARISATEHGPIFVPFPGSKTIDERVCIAADARRSMLAQLCHSLSKTVPDWWISGWLNARYLARHLGSKIAGAEGWPWMAAEFPIGGGGAVQITDDIELRLRGQIDLLLAQNGAADFTGQKIWIVDYKTGSTKELKPSDLHDALVKGTSLQLGLYALATRELGAADVQVSILSFLVKNVRPQLSIVDLEPHRAIFADLAEMQRTGIFGMKGEIRPTFGYSAPYPLATLPIDTDILEDKWALSHPALVLEKEEWEVW